MYCIIYWAPNNLCKYKEKESIKAPTRWGDNRQVPGTHQFSVRHVSAGGGVRVATKVSLQPRRTEDRKGNNEKKGEKQRKKRRQYDYKQVYRRYNVEAGP